MVEVKGVCKAYGEKVVLAETEKRRKHQERKNRPSLLRISTIKKELT